MLSVQQVRMFQDVPEALKTPPSSLTCHTIYAVLEGGQEFVVLVARIVVSLL